MQDCEDGENQTDSPDVRKSHPSSNSDVRLENMELKRFHLQKKKSKDRKCENFSKTPDPITYTFI